MPNEYRDEGPLPLQKSPLLPERACKLIGFIHRNLLMPGRRVFGLEALPGRAIAGTDKWVLGVFHIDWMALLLYTGSGCASRLTVVFFKKRGL